MPKFVTSNMNMYTANVLLVLKIVEVSRDRLTILLGRAWNHLDVSQLFTRRPFAAKIF